MQKTLFLLNEITSNRISRLVKELEESTELESVKIFIDSTGGDAVSCLSFCLYLENLKKKGIKLETISFGVCMSGACAIYLAGSYRVMYETSELMLHSIQVADSEFQDVYTAEKQQERYKNYNKLWEKYLFSKLKITKKQFSNKIKSDWYVSSAEAKKLEIVEKIIKI